MQITEAMIQAGIKKATELGLMCRVPTALESKSNHEIMRELIKAILTAAAQHGE